MAPGIVTPPPRSTADLRLLPDGSPSPARTRGVQPTVAGATQRQLIRRRQARAHTDFPPELRAHRTAVCRWALANGRSLSVEALSLVLVAKYVVMAECQRTFTEWTEWHVDHLFDEALPKVCAQRRVAPPAALGEAVWVYLEALHATGGFGAGSSPASRLYLAVSAAQEGLGAPAPSPVGNRPPIRPRSVQRRRPSSPRLR